MPAVSVIISTHNRAEHYLPRAMDSVLAQTFQDWELLVADDCSTDSTARLVQRYAKTDARIGYVCTPQNSNCQCAPKNLGVRETSAPRIAYLDDDNKWHPTHLERLVGAIGDADLIYCDRTYANDPQHPHPSPGCLGTQGPTGWDWDPQRIFFENWIDTSDILHTRASLIRLGGWDESIRRAADWNLLVRYARAGLQVRHLPEVLTTYYWHADGNVSRIPLQPIAVWTLTKNRLWHTQQMLRSLRATIGLPFDHYILDQGSTDGTPEFLLEELTAGRLAYVSCQERNIGISRGSNHLLDIILPGNQYNWIIKHDQDVIWQTAIWLERIANRWREGYILSPHVLGLVQHPGGAPRHQFDYVRRLGFVKHLGGAVNVAPRDVWEKLRKAGHWIVPAPAHGQQDGEFSQFCRDQGWTLAHCEDILCRHLGNVSEATRTEEQGIIL